MVITIVKPSFEILTPTDGILKYLELCGRTCYKSEDRITNDSASKFVRMVCKRNHESVLEHCVIGVRILGSRAMSHQLVRHRIAAYCLAGDTEVIAFASKKRSSPKRWTLKQLYDWSNDPKRKGRLELIRLRSVNESTGLLVPGKIKSVIYSGVKPVYKVTTNFGRIIRTTLEHLFYTPTGWMQLKTLRIGDKIYCNGKAALDNEEWLRQVYIQENRTRKEVAQLLNVSEATLYKSLARFGLQKPARMRPNRQPGRGIKGMFSAESRQHLRAIHLGTNNPMWKGDNASENAGRLRAEHLYQQLGTCEACDTDATYRHHCDGNTRNNDASNIMQLCNTCHAQWHIGSAVMSIYTDTIVSIEYDGTVDTYDLEMTGPNHNFSAAGFIVHNSQESQRFCNYGQKGLAVICPPSIGLDPCDYYEDKFADYGWPTWYHKDWPVKGHHEPVMAGRQSRWLTTIASMYEEYLTELDEGIKPEDARYLLPNATKTEIATTYNLRTWRHVFRERALNQMAQWEIREIMLGLLCEFGQRLPEVFGDLLNEAIETQQLSKKETP